MTTITPLPTPPQRGEAASTFTVKANNWVDALTDWTIETNAVAAEVQANADAVESDLTSIIDAGETAVSNIESAEIDGLAAISAAESSSVTTIENLRDASVDTMTDLRDDTQDIYDDAVILEANIVGIANYKGLWSSLTGSLNIPATVYHSDSYWVLNTNLADVTASEPSLLNADWVVGNGALKDLRDTTITTPSDGQLLKYDNASSKWVNYTPDPVLTKSMPDTIVDITSSQTWTVPAGIGRVKIVAVGAGGNGGNAPVVGGGQGASGGGGGGMSIKVIDVTPADSIGITISSGVATVAHTPTSTTMVANKGSDGVAGAGAGGAGGTASGGDYNYSGGAGAAYASSTSGAGGAICGNEGYTKQVLGYNGTGLTTSNYISIGGSLLNNPKSVFTNTRNGSNVIGVINSFRTPVSFSAYLLGIDVYYSQASVSFATQMTGTYKYDGVNGQAGSTLYIATSANTVGASGSETGGGSGAINAAGFLGAGGAGGSIGAGGGGSTNYSGSGTATGGTGGAAHVFILF